VQRVRLLHGGDPLETGGWLYASGIYLGAKLGLRLVCRLA